VAVSDTAKKRRAARHFVQNAKAPKIQPTNCAILTNDIFKKSSISQQGSMSEGKNTKKAGK